MRNSDDTEAARTAALLEAIAAQERAIRLCLDNKLCVPALTLIYATVDQMAYLNMPPGRSQVGADDFKEWCRTYLLPNSTDLPCTEADLWGARCGVVHAHSPESKRSREGKAREIFYAWGTSKVERPREALAELGFPQVIIHAENLFHALIKGIDSFLAGLRAHPEKARLARLRAGKMFRDQDNFAGLPEA